MKKLLVTGGAGYIGSHTVVELLDAGYEVVVYDNFSNSSPISLDRVFQITGKRVLLIEGDIRDKQKLDAAFSQHSFDGVVHFAGLKAVGESVEQPLRYYNNNVFGSLQLFNSMSEHDVKIIVFSSSATVYGDPVELPLHEKMLTGVPQNPYGMSKLMIENILSDLYASDDSWSIARLRYFNPVGAHSSGLIGEDPAGIPSNLMPFITQTALGKRKVLSVFGGDYPTPDGSGVRDYIHVVDLAKGHLAALDKCFSKHGVHTVNLGTGEGYSVLQMIQAFEKVNDVSVPYEIVERRAGDVAVCFADTQFAEEYLNWKAQLGLDEMCRDSWHWQSKNPIGYLLHEEPSSDQAI
jgi:UDP-glucose 4-epimerase